jgi:curved DNA-binding protein CbpA
MNDPYSVLGVSSNASDEEIKRAYRSWPEVPSR